MSIKRKPCKKRVKATIPKINNIGDLIAMSKSRIKYPNINMEMLWRIEPILVDINEMIGMDRLKESLVYQILFFLQDFIDTNDNFLHTLIVGEPGTGKCLGENTQVKMSDFTYANSQDIKAGDCLLGWDSTPRTVLSTCKGFGKLYDIILYDNGVIYHQFTVNSSHILSLINDNSEEKVELSVVQYLELKNPSVMRAYRVPIKKTNPIDLDFHIDHHTMGYILATISKQVDGWYIYNYDQIEMRQRLFQNNIIDDNETVLTVFFDVYKDDILSNIIPQDYLHGTQEELLELLEGLVLGFDSLVIYKNVSNPLIHQIVTLCDSLCIDYSYSKSSTNFTVNSKDTAEEYIKLNIRSLVPNQYLKYKFTIKEIDAGPYYGFELDGDKHFLLEHNIVTHNTTIAKHIGEMYKALGILSPTAVFKIGKRDDFIAEYLGQTAVKTRALLESCLGGVLFIDEAYSLGSGDRNKDSYSKEAVDTLTAFLSENNDRFCCIIAGYDDDIRNCLFNINKGLERRFQWVHHIDQYSPKDLAKIFFKIVDEMEWKTDITEEFMTNLVATNKSLFKNNGGDMCNIVIKCKMSHAKRVFNTEETKYIITQEDVMEALKLYQDMSIKDDQYWTTMFV
jgi:hypothetical protein